MSNIESRVHSIEALELLYDAPGATSLAKVSPKLTPAYRKMLEASPFCLLASSGSQGLDCSPRGDKRSCIDVINDTTLAIPDWRGNNRLDTLRNIVETGEIALCCLIPGINETLRINGTAILSTEPGRREKYQTKHGSTTAKLPVTVIVIEIREIYFQCARAIIRSGLWNPELHQRRDTLPSAGQMTKSVVEDFDQETYDAQLSERQKNTLY